jgi:hypothetical protein
MEEEPRFPSFTVWLRLVRLGIFLAILWQTRFDLLHVFLGIGAFFTEGVIALDQLVLSFIALVKWFVLLITCYAVYIFWLAQFLLPVTSWQDRRTAAWRFFLFGISAGRLHGAAVFVREGMIDTTPPEFEKKGLGVAFIDLRSAVTLDKHLEHKGDLTPASLETSSQVHFDPKSKTYVSGIRAVGPGLTFIQGNEKITGAVDLRPQSRSRKDVQADTRDGIRVKTDVSCTFTVGEPPEILDVCLGGEDGKQVFVIEWDSRLPLAFKKVKLLSKELDPGDEKEIHEFIINNRDPSRVSTDIPNSQFPFTFDEQRIERAVYSRTLKQDPSSSGVLSFKKWSDWPQDVAAEKFRILLAKWPYMNLYISEDPEKYPLKDFKRELFTQVRNTGMLAYRAIALQNGRFIEAGRAYSTNELIFYPPRHLVRLDVLRYRGIKVISANISELEPKEDTVREQLMNSWLSTKQKEADLKSADYNLEISRVKNQARVRAQQSMIYHLTQLLENQEYPREALALLIYQELEAAAANPATRKLLPADTLSLLTGIGSILLPGEKNTAKSSGGIPVIPSSDKDSY